MIPIVRTEAGASVRGETDIRHSHRDGGNEQKGKE